jgi:hypothetical protein
VQIACNRVDPQRATERRTFSVHAGLQASFFGPGTRTNRIVDAVVWADFRMGPPVGSDILAARMRFGRSLSLVHAGNTNNSDKIRASDVDRWHLQAWLGIHPSAKPKIYEQVFAAAEIARLSYWHE